MVATEKLQNNHFRTQYLKKYLNDKMIPKFFKFRVSAIDASKK